MVNRAYSMSEMRDIVAHLVERNAYSEVRARAMWQELERTGRVNRTWQSLKETFLKRILPDIHNPYYNLTPEQIASFRSGKNVGKLNMSKLTLSDRRGSSRSSDAGVNVVELSDEQRRRLDEGTGELPQTSKEGRQRSERSSEDTVVLDTADKFADAEEVINSLQAEESLTPSKSLKDMIVFTDPLTPMMQNIIGEWDSDSSSGHSNTEKQNKDKSDEVASSADTFLPNNQEAILSRPPESQSSHVSEIKASDPPKTRSQANAQVVNASNTGPIIDDSVLKSALNKKTMININGQEPVKKKVRQSKDKNGEILTKPSQTIEKQDTNNSTQLSQKASRTRSKNVLGNEKVGNFTSTAELLTVLTNSILPNNQEGLQAIRKFLEPSDNSSQGSKSTQLTENSEKSDSRRENVADSRTDTVIDSKSKIKTSKENNCTGDEGIERHDKSDSHVSDDSERRIKTRAKKKPTQNIIDITESQSQKDNTELKAPETRKERDVFAEKLNSESVSLSVSDDGNNNSNNYSRKSSPNRKKEKNNTSPELKTVESVPKRVKNSNKKPKRAISPKPGSKQSKITESEKLPDNISVPIINTESSSSKGIETKTIPATINKCSVEPLIEANSNHPDPPIESAATENEIDIPDSNPCLQSVSLYMEAQAMEAENTGQTERVANENWEVVATGRTHPKVGTKQVQNIEASQLTDSAVDANSVTEKVMELLSTKAAKNAWTGDVVLLPSHSSGSESESLPCSPPPRKRRAGRGRGMAAALPKLFGFTGGHIHGKGPRKRRREQTSVSSESEYSTGSLEDSIPAPRPGRHHLYMRRPAAGRVRALADGSLVALCGGRVYTLVTQRGARVYGHQYAPPPDSKQSTGEEAVQRTRPREAPVAAVPDAHLAINTSRCRPTGRCSGASEEGAAAAPAAPSAEGGTPQEKTCVVLTKDKITLSGDMDRILAALPQFQQVMRALEPAPQPPAPERSVRLASSSTDDIVVRDRVNAMEEEIFQKIAEAETARGGARVAPGRRERDTPPRDEPVKEKGGRKRMSSGPQSPTSGAKISPRINQGSDTDVEVISQTTAPRRGSPRSKASSEGRSNYPVVDQPSERIESLDVQPSVSKKSKKGQLSNTNESEKRSPGKKKSPTAQLPGTRESKKRRPPGARVPRKGQTPVPRESNELKDPLEGQQAQRRESDGHPSEPNGQGQHAGARESAEGQPSVLTDSMEVQPSTSGGTLGSEPSEADATRGSSDSEHEIIIMEAKGPEPPRRRGRPPGRDAQTVVAERDEASAEPEVRYMLAPSARRHNTRLIKRPSAKKLAGKEKINSVRDFSNESTQGYQDSDASPVQPMRRRRFSHQLEQFARRRSSLPRSRPRLTHDARRRSSTLRLRNLMQPSSDSESVANSNRRQEKETQTSPGKGGDKVSDSELSLRLSPNPEPVGSRDSSLPGLDNEHLRGSDGDVANSSNISLPLSPELSIVEQISVCRRSLSRYSGPHSINEQMRMDESARDLRRVSIVLDKLDFTCPLMEQEVSVSRETHEDFEREQSVEDMEVCTATVEEMVVSSCTRKDQNTVTDSLISRVTEFNLDDTPVSESVLLGSNELELFTAGGSTIEPPSDLTERQTLKVQKTANSAKRCSTPNKRKKMRKSQPPTVPSVAEEELMEHTECCVQNRRKSCPAKVSLEQIQPTGSDFSTKTGRSSVFNIPRVIVSFDGPTDTVTRRKPRGPNKPKSKVIKVKIVRPKKSLDNTEEETRKKKRSPERGVQKPKSLYPSVKKHRRSNSPKKVSGLQEMIYSDPGVKMHKIRSNTLEEVGRASSSAGSSTELIHNHSDSCLAADECAKDGTATWPDGSAVGFDSRLELTPSPDCFSSDARDSTEYSESAGSTVPATGADSLVTEEGGEAAWWSDADVEAELRARYGTHISSLYPLISAVPHLSAITEASSDTRSRDEQSRDAPPRGLSFRELLTRPKACALPISPHMSSDEDFVTCSSSPLCSVGTA